MNRIVVIGLLVLASLACHASDGVVTDSVVAAADTTTGFKYRLNVARDRIERIEHRIEERVESRMERDDSLGRRGSWLRQLARKKFDVNDTTIDYPRFVDFALKLYRWGDKTFNTYDTAYVYSVPLKWKVMSKVKTKFDTYHFGPRVDEYPVMVFNTEPRTSAGFRASFMAVGFEYMPDIDNLLSGEVIFHRLTRFTFTCSRVFVDLYYNKNTGQSRVNRFGDYNDGKFIKLKFDGLTSRTLGLDAFYVFNNKKYAHAAAYCFSKIQKRSAGSFILGLQYTNQKVDLDLTKMPVELRDYNPFPNRVFKFHHYDYALNVGYAYNWVFHHNWVFNITAVPSFGLNHIVENNVYGPENKVAVNMRGRAALVRNAGEHWFYAFNGVVNGYLTWNKNYSFYNQIFEASATVGFRF